MYRYRSEPITQKEDHMKALPTRFMTCLVLLAFSACVGGGKRTNQPIPLTPEDIKPTLEINIQNITEQIEDNLSWIQEAEMLPALFGLSQEDTQGPTEPEDGMPVDEPEESPNLGTELSQSLMAFMDEHVMPTLKSSDGKVHTATLDVISMLCTVNDVEPGTETVGDEGKADAAIPNEVIEPSGVINPDCAKQFEGITVQIEILSFETDDLDITLLINDLRPLTLEVHKNRLAARIRLADLKAALGLFIDNMPNENQPPFGIDQAKGEWVVGFKTDGNGTLSLFTEVAKAIELSAQYEGQEIALSVGQSQANIVISQNDNTLSAEANVGPVAVRVPGNLIDGLFGHGMDCSGGAMVPAADNDDFPEDPNEFQEPDCGPSEPAFNGSFEMKLAGLTGKVTLHNDSKAITLTHFGLGSATSTLAYNGENLVAVDLNKDIGRVLNAGLSFDENTKTGNVSLDPGMVVSLALSLDSLLDDSGDESPWFANETFKISFLGDAPGLVFGDGFMKVEGGTLSLESMVQPQFNATFEDGDCMTMSNDGPGQADFPAPVEKAPDTDTSDDDDASSDDEENDVWIEEEEEVSHPFALLEKTQCGG
jgi:hypothetical protein